MFVPNSGEGWVRYGVRYDGRWRWSLTTVYWGSQYVFSINSLITKQTKRSYLHSQINIKIHLKSVLLLYGLYGWGIIKKRVELQHNLKVSEFS